MGGKGSGRKVKPLSEVFAGISDEIAELEDYVYRKCNALHMRINYHVWKQQKKEEYRRKFRESERDRLS